MRQIIIILLVLTFSVSPAFGLSKDQEANIALTDKLVKSEATVRELDAKLAHAKEGEKFYWFVIGTFLMFTATSN